MKNKSRDKILILPHIGNAYGHLIRSGQFVGANNSKGASYFMACPENINDEELRHIPDYVNIISHASRFSVSSTSGSLDFDGLSNVIDDYTRIAKSVNPSIIVGSPGILAGRIATAVETPWIALAHGCYLPIPSVVKQSSDRITDLANLAWSTARAGISDVLRVISNNDNVSWAELRGEAQVLIPNRSYREPSQIGRHIGSRMPEIGWSEGDPCSLLITLCSSGENCIPKSFLTYLTKRYDDIVITGPTDSSFELDDIEYVGSEYSISSLVGPSTTVITHGGHGTLRSVNGAQRVIMMPGDIDQLCNSIIAHSTLGYELVSVNEWFGRLNSSSPFKRYINWGSVREYMSTKNVYKKSRL